MANPKKDDLYYGLPLIAQRLGLSQPLARRWILNGRITAWRDGDGFNSPWMTTEKLILEDLNRLAEKHLKR
nr:hypothetical protein 8 [Desulfobacteraceae bacterium]